MCFLYLTPKASTVTVLTNFIEKLSSIIKPSFLTMFYPVPTNALIKNSSLSAGSASSSCAGRRAGNTTAMEVTNNSRIISLL